MGTDDPFDLGRFLTAQERDFPRALAELRAGAKRTHWIWSIFPQHVALGRSETARRYGIASLAEARAYLAHPVLRDRLAAAVAATLASGETDPVRLFGRPDDLKVRSSLTLFLAADTDGPVAPRLREVLAVLYDGTPDPATLAILAQGSDHLSREGG
jgi:uncharacterized protein (DUF1810 family)